MYILIILNCKNYFSESNIEILLLFICYYVSEKYDRGTLNITV